MAVSYKRLWKILIDKDMKKSDLEREAHLTHYSLSKLTKGQDVTKPNITPEMVAEAITGSVSGMEGVDPEALKQFNQALIGLLTVKPTEDEHDGS